MPRTSQFLTLSYFPSLTYKWQLEADTTYGFRELSDVLNKIQKITEEWEQVLPIPRYTMTSPIPLIAAVFIMKQLGVKLPPNTCVALPDSDTVLARRDADCYEILYI